MLCKKQMQWLIEIFASPGDKARLVTTLLAVAMALAVVFINQYFASKRARKETLIKKVEEVSFLLLKIKDIFYEIHNGTITNWGNSDELDKLDILNKELIGHIDSARVLSFLYFPILSNSTKKLCTEYVNYHVYRIEAEGLSKYIESYKSVEPDIDNIFKELKGETQSIMEDVMH